MAEKPTTKQIQSVKILEAGPLPGNPVTAKDIQYDMTVITHRFNGTDVKGLRVKIKASGIIRFYPFGANFYLVLSDDLPGTQS